MAYILHQAPAIHSHGVGGYEQLESAGGCLPGHAPLPGSTSVRAAFVHVVGDLLQSIGVLVAATIIYFKVRGPCVGWAPVLHRALGGTGGHWVPGGPSPACWRFLPAASRSPCSLQPQCKIADPISTLFFSVFVLGSTLTILRDVFRVLMEGEGGTGKGVQGLLREHRAAHPTATSAPYPAHPQHSWPL